METGKRKKKMLKKINGVLPDLIWGILGYGLIVQLVGVWFVKDKIYYAIGLWLGIAAAAGLAIHMAAVIRDTMDPDMEKQAIRRRAFFSISRYAAAVILFVIVLYFDLGNAIAMFIGIMGLKISAYLQPLTHRLIGDCRKLCGSSCRNGSKSGEKEDNS